MSGKLSAYLERIGFDGEPAVDIATLRRLQTLHLQAIPYENLDVQLGRALSIDPDAAFDKIVRRRRGGWCYEMNGLFGWALAEVGFSVTRLASGVMRSAFGDGAAGNHLVLRVDLDRRQHLADVGLGDGPIYPFAIVPGPFVAGGSAYAVEALEGGWWRLRNREGARPPDFDFHLDNTDEDRLAETCLRLQTDPSSIFVQNLICQRFVADGHLQLIGRVLSLSTAAGASQRLLASADELMRVLREDFAIDEPAAAGLWPRICARHEELFGQTV